MPELPDIEVYLVHLRRRLLGEPLERVRVASPFLVRSFDPPLTSVSGRQVVAARRVGKRIALGLQGDLWLVVHLMVAGRFRWREVGAKTPAKVGLAAFDFPKGTLLLTEASTKKRASLHVVRGEAGLHELDPGGVEPLEVGEEEFAATLRSERHTVKRALTDPHLFSGIGNAYSDEILWRAQTSPVRMTTSMSDEEIARVHGSTVETLRDWTERLTREAGDDFPEKVTAFRDGMAVHGRYRQPCPRCGAPVQRIAYADNEANYCARCQTGGKLLADRSLSRLMRGDWPKTLDELEERKRAATEGPDQPRSAVKPSTS